MFNLFILDYFGLFSFGFRLSVHLELTSKSGDQKLLKDLHVVTEMHFLLQKNLKNIMHGRVKMYAMR